MKLSNSASASALWLALSMSPLTFGQISISTSPYSQDFDALGTSSVTAAGGNLGAHSVSLTGWYFLESGSSANTTMTAGTGSSNTGDTYNTGLASNSNRKLGGLQSNSLIPSFGFFFTNSTGSTVAALNITYSGETWRVAGTNRSDRLDFQYSTTATSLSGTFTDFNALDYVNDPVPSTGSGSLIQTSPVSGKLMLTIPTGSSVFLRWSDFNVGGSDDLMAVENFSMVLAPAVPKY